MFVQKVVYSKTPKNIFQKAGGDSQQTNTSWGPSHKYKKGLASSPHHIHLLRFTMFISDDSLKYILDSFVGKVIIIELIMASGSIWLLDVNIPIMLAQLLHQSGHLLSQLLHCLQVRWCVFVRVFCGTKKDRNGL